MFKPAKYIRSLLPHSHGNARTKEILNVNPTLTSTRPDAEEIFITVYNFDGNHLEEKHFTRVEDCLKYRETPHITWINIDGLRKADVATVSERFGIHPLISEDIMSVGQRPKMDEVDKILYCLLNMLYFDDNHFCVELEQISIILGNKFVITFQEDARKDVFNPIREKLKFPDSKIRQRGADYLCYSMLDLIVDNYFFVMEKIGNRIEEVEDSVIQQTDRFALRSINQIRKELIILKRNIAPVRDLISSLIRSESNLLDDRITTYFKDVQDHITQAYELSENYRDVMISMQDLYINNVNLKMNEVMKVIAIVTCLMAPATVIGGIFGMNFDSNVSFFHKPWGFYSAVAVMLLVPLLMLYGFKKKGWFRQ